MAILVQRDSGWWDSNMTVTRVWPYGHNGISFLLRVKKQARDRLVTHA
jgi:hypothetical protein